MFISDYMNLASPLAFTLKQSAVFHNRTETACQSTQLFVVGRFYISDVCCESETKNGW